MEYVKLKEIASIVTGGTPSTSKKEYWENGTIPWLQSGCCQNCNVISSSSFITQEGYDNSVTKLMPKDTILIALTGATAGKVGYLTFEACGNQSITGITLNKDNLPKFLFYYLLYLRPKILRDCVGGAQPHISQGYVKEIDYPSLSKNKQQEIVSILDTINNIIDADKKQLELLDEAVKSRFIEMFGEPNSNPKNYPIMKIDELFDVGSSKRVFESEWTDSGVPFYRTREIVKLSQDGFVNNELFITEEMFEKYKDKYGVPKADDMMVTGVGTLGVCYIVKESDRFYFKDGNTLWFKNKGLCDVRFIKDQYDTDFVKEQINRNANASTVGTYTITNAKNTLVLVPPIEEQHQYIEFVKLIDKSKFNIQQHLNLMQELLDKKMDEYFGG